MWPLCTIVAEPSNVLSKFYERVPVSSLMHKEAGKEFLSLFASTGTLTRRRARDLVRRRFQEEAEVQLFCA